VSPSAAVLFEAGPVADPRLPPPLGHSPRRGFFAYLKLPYSANCRRSISPQIFDGLRQMPGARPPKRWRPTVATTRSNAIFGGNC